MLKFSIVEFCSDLSLLKAFVNQGELFDMISQCDDQRISTVCICGQLNWHAIESLLVEREIIQSADQLISLFCRSFDSVEEIHSLCNFPQSIVFI
jgi:hypothetical protein